MKRVFPIALSIFILFAVSMAFVVVETSNAGETKEMATEEVDLEAAKVTFEETCAKCHATSRALKTKKDMAGWEKTVGRMASYHKRQKGGPISDEDQNSIVQYLVSVAGK